MAHANARLGPAGRRELVRLMIDEGMPERRAAARLWVSPCTAHRWKRRWLAAGERERRSGAWALDRSSRPHRSPARTPAAVERRVLDERERTGWGPRLIAGQTGVPASTVHSILRRHGCSRPPRASRETFVRYEWPCPGDLLHMDVKRYRRFRRPGHPFISDERQTSKEINTQLGYDYFHAIVDDHSRLADGELLADTRAGTVTAFTARALTWFARHGITVRRLMTDGAWSYRHNRSLRELLAARGIRHIITPPYTPASTARSNASTRPWTANGRADRSTATAAPETAHCHTGLATTTTIDPTAHSAANPRSPALSTSKGTTPTQRS